MVSLSAESASREALVSAEKGRFHTLEKEATDSTTHVDQNDDTTEETGHLSDTESYHSEQEAAEAIKEEMMKRLESLGLDEEKAMANMIYVYALGGSGSVIDYLRNAREFAKEKGVDITQVLSPGGDFYQRFVEHIRNQS